MKKAIILVILGFLCFIFSQNAQAKWWIFGQGGEEININYIYINKNSYDESGEKLTLSKETLQNGIVKISGKASTKRNKIGAVLVSKDNKQTWEKAGLTSNGVFEFNFIPQIDKEYDVYIKIIDTVGKSNNVDDTYKKIVVVNNNITQMITDALNQAIRAYENEEPNLFMTFVSPDFAGDEAVLDSAVRKDFTAFDYIKLNYFINNISSAPSGKVFVSLKYIRTVVSTKNGRTYSDEGYTEIIFNNEDGKPKIFAMKNPLIFGLSNASEVATGKIQNTNNNPIIIVDSSGNVDEKPFNQAINIIETGSSASQTVESGNFTLVSSSGPSVTQGYTFESEAIGSSGDFMMEFNIQFLDSGVSIYEIGVSALSDIASVNSTGYVYTGPGGAYTINAGSVGKCYALKIGNKYAVIRVKSYSEVGSTSTIQFEYKYQTDGSTDF
jgi:hypothetical protein